MVVQGSGARLLVDLRRASINNDIRHPERSRRSRCGAIALTYGSSRAVLAAVRERVGLLDLSSFAKFEVTGRDSGAFLDRIFANRMPRKVGGITLAHRLGENGRIHGESTITRLAEERYYVLSGASWEIRDEDGFRQARVAGEDVSVENVTDHIGILVLAGPRARDASLQLGAPHGENVPGMLHEHSRYLRVG